MRRSVEHGTTGEMRAAEQPGHGNESCSEQDVPHLHHHRPELRHAVQIFGCGRRGSEREGVKRYRTRDACTGRAVQHPPAAAAAVTTTQTAEEERISQLDRLEGAAALINEITKPRTVA